MYPLIENVHVRDVMKTDFNLIDGIATIYEALILMKKNRTSLLVVNKRSEDDEYGMLLVSDIAREVLAKNRPVDRVNVYEIMQKPAVCVEPEMDIRYCARLFSRFDLVRALVVDKREIVGTISPNALVLEGMYRALEGESSTVE